MSEENSDFGDYDSLKCSEDANDTVAQNGKTRTRMRNRNRTRKSSAGLRKIQHRWRHEEVVCLIAAVAKRRGLWDLGSYEYKLSKMEAWREVCKELGSHIDLKEVKLKWSSLRVSFKVNLANIRKKTPEKEVRESASVSWRYFQQMIFLDTGNVCRSTKSTSRMDLSSTIDGHSVLSNCSVPTVLSISAAAEGTPKKLQSVTEAPLISPASLSNSSSSIPKKTLVPLQTPDRNSTFCDHILAELKSLPEAKAYNLRRVLNQTLWDFLDADHTKQSQAIPVRLVNAQMQTIPLNTLKIEEEELIEQY